MFKVDSSQTFSRVVTVHVPVDGGFREETLKATFLVTRSTKSATVRIWKIKKSC